MLKSVKPLFCSQTFKIVCFKNSPLQNFTNQGGNSNFLFSEYFTYIYRISNIAIHNLKEKYIMARVLISMPEDFLNRIDEVAEGENRTRSELIREALRSYMYKSRVKSSTIATKNAAILEALLD